MMTDGGQKLREEKERSILTIESNYKKNSLYKNIPYIRTYIWKNL